MASPPFKLSRRHVVKTRTAGNYVLNSLTWANVDTAIDIAIPAAVGDDIRVGISALWNSDGVTGILQVATWNGTSLVNWIGSGEPTTTTGDGISGWYGPSSVLMPIGASMLYTVVAGDIVADTNLGPQVTLRMRARTGTASNKSLLANTGDPFQWWAENLGPAYGSGL